MKTKVTSIGRFAGLAVAVTLFTAASLANAQEKGATRLLQLNAPAAAAATTAATYTPMSCANCKDSFITVRDTDVKGAGAKTLLAGGPPMKVVATHLCGSCSNEWVVKGHGKAAISVPVHKCGSCG
jgi:hypothetical protein